MRYRGAILKLFGLIGSLSSACFIPAYASEVRPTLPLFEHAYEPRDLDERGLWQKWDEYEKEFARSPAVYHAPDLVNYVKGVLCETVGFDRCGATRIYIVRDTNFNASMAPNGIMSVNTGLLLRVKNEAELASVLGHEFAHFEQRHSLNSFKKRRRGSDLVSWMTIVAGAAAAAGGSGAYQHHRDYRTSIYGEVYRYERDQERESDILSAQYLVISSYSSGAGAHVWLRLLDEDAEQARERKRSRRRQWTGWADSHPSSFERADYLSRLAEEANDEGVYKASEYMEAIRSYMPEFFDDQLQRNDFSATKFLLEQIAQDGWTPDLLFLQGELYRKRGNPRDLVTAATAYLNAIEAGYENPNAWRGLGLSQMRSGAQAEGKQTLKTYIRMAPDAPDASMITLLIGEE